MTQQDSNAVQLVARAWMALKSNRTAVITYVGASTVLGVVQLLLVHYLGSLQDDDASAWHDATRMGVGMGYATTISLLQTLCFAYLGRSIDKPLWKFDGPADALKRFLLIWFLLNLNLLLIVNLQVMAVRADQPDLFGALELLLVLFYVPYLPLGAAIMFAGRFREWHLIDAIAPFGRRPLPTLTVCLTMLFLYLLNMLMYEVKQDTFLLEVINYGAFSILLSGMEILVFAATWLLCIDDRNEETNESQDPFDF